MSDQSRALPNVLPPLLWSALALLPLVALAWRVDRLTLAFAALTLFVGATVATFSQRYMRADRHVRAYSATVGLLVTSVLVCVASTNMALLALAWIASGVLLARLIGHGDNWPEARAAARRARIAFAMGDSALVAALALLAWHSGSWQIATALAHVASLPAAWALAIACLLLVAGAARCALPPFSGWLLSSMTAPTPVSALMHAGLVNAGGFLLLRFASVFEAAPLARWGTVLVGLAAAVHGLGIMLVRPDIKRALAGSTVSQMGFMIMSCGLGVYSAALWHIVAHGLFKAWLFLGSGSSIGMHASLASPARANAVPVIAGLALVCGAALLSSGHADATLVPFLLGIATAAAMLAGALQSALSLRARLTLVVALAGLACFHAAGLLLARVIARPDAPSVLPGWALVGLSAGFLGLWVWQWLARDRPMPALLYVRLLNAGAFPHFATGDAQ